MFLASLARPTKGEFLGLYEFLLDLALNWDDVPEYSWVAPEPLERPAVDISRPLGGIPPRAVDPASDWEWLKVENPSA